MGAIRSLCQHTLLLEGGRAAVSGSTEEVVTRYLSAGEPRITIPVSERADRSGSGRVRIADVYFEDDNCEATQRVPSGGAVRLRVLILNQGAL